jgi:hypothetical protein
MRYKVEVLKCIMWPIRFHSANEPLCESFSHPTQAHLVLSCTTYEVFIVTFGGHVSDDASIRLCYVNSMPPLRIRVVPSASIQVVNSTANSVPYRPPPFAYTVQVELSIQQLFLH